MVHTPGYLGIISKLADRHISPLSTSMLNMKANTAVIPQLSSDQKRFIRLCHDAHAASGHNIYFSRSCFIFYFFIFISH